MFPLFNMGYEIFPDCVEISSALVPRVENDHSLRKEKDFTFRWYALLHLTCCGW